MTALVSFSSEPEPRAARLRLRIGRRIGRGRILAGLAVAVLLVSACGQDDSEPAAGEPAAAPAQSEPAPPPAVVEPAPEPDPPPEPPPPPDPPPAPPEPESPPEPEASPEPESEPVESPPTTATEPPPEPEPEPAAAPPAPPEPPPPAPEPPPPPEESPPPDEPAPEPEAAQIFDAPGALELPLPLEPGDPGDLIDVEKLDVGDDLLGYRILHHSRSIRDEDIAVSGFVVTPAGDPPAGGWPLLAWAHGTVGTADMCAPSHDAEDAVAAWAAYLEGYAVVATDYEGLGTPGLHPYVVGRSEARSVLDSVRAAQRLPDISVSDEFVVWGHSQGGHAALHTGQHWQAYAPELQLLGVASGAPPSQFSLLYNVLLGGPYQGYVAMASAAFAAAYGDLDLLELFSEEAIGHMAVLEEGCTEEVLKYFAPLDPEDLMVVDTPMSVPAWAAVIVENDVNQAPIPVPTIILHGANDEQIPALSSQFLLGQLCLLEGQGPALRIEYPNQNHSSVIAAQHADLLAWIADRFAGEPAPDSCA